MLRLVCFLVPFSELFRRTTYCSITLYLNGLLSQATLHSWNFPSKTTLHIKKD
jgi:hypothetical protein